MGTATTGSAHVINTLAVDGIDFDISRERQDALVETGRAVRQSGGRSGWLVPG